MEVPRAFSKWFYCRLDAAEEKRSALSEHSEFADHPELHLSDSQTMKHSMEQFHTLSASPAHPPLMSASFRPIKRLFRNIRSPILHFDHLGNNTHRNLSRRLRPNVQPNR